MLGLPPQATQPAWGGGSSGRSTVSEVDRNKSPCQVSYPANRQPCDLTMRFFYLFLTSGLTVLTPLCSEGSGSYTHRLPAPSPPSGVRSTPDQTRYALGQKIYKEQDTASIRPAPANLVPRLEALQALLPASEAKKIDLRKLAGHLAEDQLSALEYFVKERFPARTKP